MSPNFPSCFLTQGFLPGQGCQKDIVLRIKATVTGFPTLKA